MPVGQFRNLHASSLTTSKITSIFTFQKGAQMNIVRRNLIGRTDRVPEIDEAEFKKSWPFYWVSQINAAYENALERRLKHLGIDIARWRALMSLYDDGYLSVSEISEHSAQKLNTTTKVVQRMVKDGLVTTRVRPTDRRVTEVNLSEKGENLRREAFKEAQAIYNLVFDGQSEKDVETLNAELSRLHERLKKL
ncbi:MarR family winged helix-turn-helix transcriptional regulator [Roseobacter sp.]|uniref:MarR family winged helix-turn-helix transcriptional regulator n=1 Tax=Roseobacter sp. TaxID=1907202 RepID=UPI0029670E5A|nr:MarR family winged helix-turn-helix transcriptional regulator [Roseobacter sp.]MDW3182767.1 MarR family winged helix-turn-helix transcriptional regulator [Roseobacter sp.]